MVSLPLHWGTLPTYTGIGLQAACKDELGECGVEVASCLLLLEVMSGGLGTLLLPS